MGFFRGTRAAYLGAQKNLYDPSAQAYFTKLASVSGGVAPDANEKYAANRAITRLKAGGHWNTLDYCQLISPSSASGALVCAKTLISMTNVNSMSWSQSGFYGDGATTYLKINQLLGSYTYASANGAHVHGCQNGVDYDSSYLNVQGLFGAANSGGGYQGYFDWNDSTSEFEQNLTAGHCSRNDTDPDAASIPLLTQLTYNISLPDSNTLQIFANGSLVLVGTVFTAPAQPFAPLPLYIGAVDYNDGTAAFQTNFEIRSFLIGGPRNPSQAIDIDTIILDYQTDIGFGRGQGV